MNLPIGLSNLRIQCISARAPEAESQPTQTQQAYCKKIVQTREILRLARGKRDLRTSHKRALSAQQSG